MAELEMTIDSIRVSMMNYQRVVILREKMADRYLPIWIGPTEADAIAVKLQGISVPRPLTHDFIRTILESLSASVKSACINKLDNDCFFAKVTLISNNEPIEIDCRPSDALALAVRVNAPIFVEERVLNKAGILLDPETGKPMEGSVDFPQGDTATEAERMELPTETTETPLTVLKLRYAKGEITKEEYDQVRRDLSG
ncbi:bifunctional nuclease domain-containing protein [Chloroflexota bacterium]